MMARWIGGERFVSIVLDYQDPVLYIWDLSSFQVQRPPAQKFQTLWETTSLNSSKVLTRM